VNWMQSVLNSLFPVPVSSEEKRPEHYEENCKSASPVCYSAHRYLGMTSPIAERAAKKDPSQYLLIVEQMA
jgi:hypothetical protein